MSDTNYHLRVCAVIRRVPDELLVVSEQFRGEERLNLPGGAPHYGETLQAAVVREVLEETGYAVNPGEIAYVAEHRQERWDDIAVEICFYADVRTVPDKRPLSEVTDVHWLPLNDPRLLAAIPGAAYFANSARGRYFTNSSKDAL